MLKLYVDFNSIQRDKKERVFINLETNKSLVSLFVSGTQVLLTDEDMEVEAELEFDEQKQVWFGVPDWATKRDVLEESNVPHAVRS